MKFTTFILAAGLCLTASAQELKSDLPHVSISTDNGQEITSTDVYTTATLTITSPEGKTNTYATTKVRGRGKTLFTLEKKPYKLKLAKKAALAGEEYAIGKKWNLMADHGDKTLLRNSVASFIALEAGQPFAPLAKYVDLTVNGNYQGTYRLTDQIDIRTKRVNITEQPEKLTSDTDISGGYLLEIDDSADDQEGSVIISSKGVKITIKSPDEDVINQTQISYITEHINKFEAALFGDNWLNETEGYRKYLDTESLIQWYITAELTAEPNSFKSVYFYKDKANDKFFFGPVWDFDFACDNSAKWGSRPKALVAQEGRGKDWSFTWINRLRQDPKFLSEVNSAWKTLIANGLIDKTLQHIDQTAQLIDKSQKLNFGLYSINEKAHDEQHLFSTYEEGVTFLKDFISERSIFLTDAFEKLSSGQEVPVTGAEDSINEIETPQYYVSIVDNELRFASVEALSGSWSIYSLSGKEIASGEVKPSISLSNIPAGAYVLSWNINGQSRSSKFVLK